MNHLNKVMPHVAQRVRSLHHPTVLAERCAPREPCSVPPVAGDPDRTAEWVARGRVRPFVTLTPHAHGLGRSTVVVRRARTRSAKNVVGIVVGVLIAVAAVAPCSWASMGINFGWRSYSGDLCGDCEADATNVKTLGIQNRSSLMGLIDLGTGLDYAWGDVESGCDGDGEFSHFAVRVSGAVPLASMVVARLYVGGGLSYNWLEVKGAGCSEVDETRTGYYGLTGLRGSLPGLPASAYIEGRVERLTGSPGITVWGVSLGAGISF